MIKRYKLFIKEVIRVLGTGYNSFILGIVLVVIATILLVTFVINRNMCIQ